MELEQKKELYEEEGVVQNAGGAIIALVVVVSVATLVLIFTTSLGGQTFNLVETDIAAISNETVREHVGNAIISGFESMETTGDYMPLIVLAVVIFLILTLVLSFTAFSNGGGGRSAL